MCVCVCVCVCVRACVRACANSLYNCRENIRYWISTETIPENGMGSVTQVLPARYRNVYSSVFSIFANLMNKK